MKVIYNRFIPIGNRFHAINLFGVIFAKGPCDDVMLNHEAIHTAQMLEMAYLGFYLVYLVEWIIRLAGCRDAYKAYKDISFEREAYARQSDVTYLACRRHFSMFRRQS